MTSRADIGQGDFDTLDVEGMLESYVLATRIVASEPFVRRIQERLAQEPPLTPWRRAWRSVRNLASTAFGREQVTAAVRLQALALLILGALAFGIAVGGAGFVVVSLVREVTEAPGPHRPNEVFPVATGGATPSVPSAAPTSTSDSRTPKPKTGGSHGAGDSVRQRGVSRNPTHVSSAAGGGQPTPSPRPTRSPRPTQPPPTASPSGGGETPPPTMAATPSPTVAPTPTGTADPSPVPSSSPEPSPEASATAGSSAPPTATPTAEPVPTTTPVPSIAPTVGPTAGPSPSPT